MKSKKYRYFGIIKSMTDTLKLIYEKYTFDSDWTEQLEKLIKLNNGYLNSMLVRACFGISWATSAKLVEELAANDCVKILEPDGKGVLLPPEYRRGGLIEE